jgi:uncharacterized protein with PIN domain
MQTVTLVFQDEPGRLVSASTLVLPHRHGGPALVVHRLTEPTSVKDLIEALGVPHCEAGPVYSLTTRKKIPLDSLTAHGDVLEVRTAQPRRFADPRFLCDGHLGKLARLLRVMGFDTAWDDSWSEARMARRGVNEIRTVLSRSRSLLKRAAMDNAMLIRSDEPDQQALEVMRRFQLARQVRMFGRCSKCNALLREVAKAEIASRIPPRTAKWLDTYYLCRECDQLFWEGTHVTALRLRIAKILARFTGPDRPEPS